MTYQVDKKSLATHGRTIHNIPAPAAVEQRLEQIGDSVFPSDHLAWSTGLRSSRAALGVLINDVMTLPADSTNAITLAAQVTALS